MRRRATKMYITLRYFISILKAAPQRTIDQFLLLATFLGEEKIADVDDMDGLVNVVEVKDLGTDFPIAQSPMQIYVYKTSKLWPARNLSCLTRRIQDNLFLSFYIFLIVSLSCKMVQS